MKIDIDKALAKFEVFFTVPGTSITRTLADVKILKERGLKLRPDELARESLLVWSLALGPLMMPKVFFHGRTIHEAIQRARKAFAKGSLKDGWGATILAKPKPKKKAPRSKKSVKRRGAE